MDIAPLNRLIERYGAERIGLWLLPVAAAAAAALVGLLAEQPAYATTAGRSTVALVRAAAGPVQAPKAPINLANFGEPLPGYAVVSPFGLRQLPWEERARLHAGLDIVAPLGAAVRAVSYGVVQRTGTDSGYGRYVEVLHLGGVTSFYAHLGSIDGQIKTGATVGPGQILGEVGSTGASTGAHLHFEMRNANHRPLDPAFFLGKAFARIEDWPLVRAAVISPKIRIAVVSNIPASKWELMLAREEAAADEQAMKNLGLWVLEPAPDVQALAAAPEIPEPAVGADGAPEADPTREPETSEPAKPAIVVVPPRRPATPPRLAMPD